MPELYDHDDILRRIRAGLRDDFQEDLAKAFEGLHKLTPEEWLAFARKAPDRAVQALTMLAKGAGYHDKLEIEGSTTIQAMSKLSDAQLEKKLKEMRTHLLSLPEYQEYRGAPDSDPPTGEGESSGIDKGG